MWMRNATITGLVAVTTYGSMHLGSNSAGMMLVDAGQYGFGANVPVWVMAAVVAAAIYSFCREAVVSVPSVFEDWPGERKLWLFAGSALLGLAAYAVA